MAIAPGQLAELIDRHGAALALYAARWTRWPDDCVQEALVELTRESRLPDRPSAWLFAVVRRRAMNAHRADSRRTRHEQQAWTDRLDHAPDESLGRELRDALAQLSPAGQEVLVLRTWGGLTLAEVAEVLGSSTTTVHRQYVAALEQLRQLWSEPCETKTRTN